MQKKVIVIGGGLAGLNSAKKLVDAGYSVEVHEGMPFFGGRASTYKDASGTWIEQGVHLFLGTYAEFRGLLEEVGQQVDEALFWTDELRFRDPVDGVDATYGISPLTSPLKTLTSVIGQNDYLGLADKAGLAAAIAAAARPLSVLESSCEDINVTDWWRQLGGSDIAFERLVRPFCAAIQFTAPEQFSAYNFLTWLHHVLKDPVHAQAGGYRGPREEVVFQPICRHLRSRGVALHANSRLERIELDAAAGRIERLHMADGRVLQADAFVLALPVWHLVPLLPPALRAQPYFQGMAELPICPAISVQIWFDRPVIGSMDFTMMARSPLPVYQEQAMTYGYEGGGKISASLTPADAYMGRPDDELLAIALEHLCAAEPTVRGAQVRKSVILRHKNHLVRPLPGAMRARPEQRTPVANMVVAGDWTQQPYFGSQEGAVISGRLAAEALIAAQLRGGELGSTTR